MISKGDALDELGLSQDADEDEIRTRFRELAKQHHPDQGADGPDAFTRLLELRDAALGERDTNTLVRLNDVADLVQAVTGPLVAREQRRERREETEAVKHQVIRVQITPLKAARRQTSVLAAIVALLAVLSQLIRAIPAIDDVVATALGGALGFYAALVGLVIWLRTQQMTRIKDAIEDATDALDDRQAFVDVVRAIAPEKKPRGPWRRSDLVAQVDRWLVEEAPGPLHAPRPFMYLLHSRRRYEMPLSARAQLIGAEDFVKLLMAKGKEHQLLRTHERWLNDQLVVTYWLDVAAASQSNQRFAEKDLREP